MPFTRQSDFEAGVMVSNWEKVEFFLWIRQKVPLTTVYFSYTQFQYPSDFFPQYRHRPLRNPVAPLLHWSIFLQKDVVLNLVCNTWSLLEGL